MLVVAGVAESTSLRPRQAPVRRSVCRGRLPEHDGVIVSRRKPGPAHDAVMAGIARMRRFEREKAAWLRDHPGATADELRRALDQLAARLTRGA